MLRATQTISKLIFIVFDELLSTSKYWNNFNNIITLRQTFLRFNNTLTLLVYLHFELLNLYEFLSQNFWSIHSIFSFTSLIILLWKIETLLTTH